jgi:hypothetical protein
MKSRGGTYLVGLSGPVIHNCQNALEHHISCYLCILLKFSLTLITFDKPTTAAVNISFYNYLLQPMMFDYHLDSDGCHNSSCLIKCLGKIEEPSTKSGIDDKKYC